MWHDFEPAQLSAEPAQYGNLNSSLANTLHSPVTFANIRFDLSTGQLSIRGDAGNNRLEEWMADNGYVQINLDGQMKSSDPLSAFYDARLDGATDKTLSGINFDGGDGIDTLIVGNQNLSGNLTVAADDDILINGNLASTGQIDIAAETITTNGEIAGRNISLKGSDALKLETGAHLTAQDGDKGGTIHLLGKEVSLTGAAIDASGRNGGGTVLIGGDYQGKGSVPTAQRTFVSSDTVINANALQSGNGGRVIVWADDTTRFSGKINARGGSLGDGGFVEVSGKQNLGFDGNTDLTAAHGKIGTLLLDPTNIVVSDAENDNSDPITTYINAASLTQQGSSVFLTAANNITVENLSFENRGVGSVSFQAGNIFNAGGINANGRSISIQAKDITVNFLSTVPDGDGTAGNINLTADNSITANTLYAFSGETGNAGNISLDATKIDVTGFMTTASANGNGGNISLTADNDISTQGIAAYTNSTTGASAGNIFIQSYYGKVAVNDYTSVVAANKGNSGNISVKALGRVSVSPLTAAANDGNAGDIFIESTSSTVIASGLDASSQIGEGGNIEVKASKNISTQSVTSHSMSQSGGNVSLRSDVGNVTVNGELYAFGGGGNGGNIFLKAGVGGVTVDGFTTAATQGGNGGKIQVETGISSGPSSGSGGSEDPPSSNSGKIDLKGVVAYSENGNGGSITFNSAGSITVDGWMYTYGGSSGDGGNMALRTTGGAIEVRDIMSSAASNGNGGNIDIITGYNNIKIGTLYAYGGTNGNGGNVTLKAESGNIDVGGFLTTAANNGKAGTILIDAAAGRLAGRGNITTKGVVSYSEQANGGNITVKGDGDVTLDGRVTSQAVRSGISGNISITSNDQNITVNGAVRSDSKQGTGGNITIDAGKLVKITGSESVDELDYSIYTGAEGIEGEGSITIKHGGGAMASPFVVGTLQGVGTTMPFINGTVANISSASSGIFATLNPLVYPGNRVIGDISIITNYSGSNPQPYVPINPSYDFALTPDFDLSPNKIKGNNITISPGEWKPPGNRVRPLLDLTIE